MKKLPWKLIGVVLFFAISWAVYWKFGNNEIAFSTAPPSSSQAKVLETVEAAPPQTSLSLITEPGDGMQGFENAMQNAKSSVDLVMYELQDQTVEQELVADKNKGISVRVLLDNLDSFGNYPNQPAYDFLQKSGVAVQWTPAYFALTHQKTLIVDDSSAWIMTFNLTPQYYASSRDFGVVDTDAADVKAIEDTFTKDWQGLGIGAPENGDDLVWSPGSETVLLQMINSAKSSLDVYNEEMADSAITQALEAAAKRGVAVRVDMTYETDWKQAFNNLTAAGVSVKTYASTAKFYIHAKAIIADNNIAFVGSENFSEQSLDYNRELGILITQPSIIDSLENIYNADWAGSRPYVAK